MKKLAKMILFCSLVCMLPGCNAGSIIYKGNQSVYYMQTDYVDESFAVISLVETDTGYNVTFTNNPDADTEGGLFTTTLKPNTYVCVPMTYDEYNKLIGGYPSFQATISIMTVISMDGKCYSSIVNDESLEKNIRQTLHTEEVDVIKNIDEYASTWKFAKI